jgi:TRAP-type transport system small permease protein
MTVASPPAAQRVAHAAMAACLGVMALAVFINVVLRYGFGSGIAASEELSRLLFVWMVFIGATAAYPAGEHMAFTALVRRWQGSAGSGGFHLLRRLIHALVLLACGLVAWGAWQQVVVGWSSRSVVIGYPTALLPLPALLSSVAIGVMASINLWRAAPVETEHELEVE